VDLLGADFATLTVLREPVERTISQLRRFQCGRNREMSLESIYERTVRKVAQPHGEDVLLTADEVRLRRTRTWPLLLSIDFTPERLAARRNRSAST
jgi:hypothetical protein